MAGGGTVFRNRIDSVEKLFQADQQNFGTVVQVEHQTVNYHAAAGPSQGPLLKSLRQLDRQDQIERLAELVLTARGEPRTSPLVVILNSLPDDEATSFVQRLGEHGFRADIALDCEYLGSFDWPRSSAYLMVTQLLSAICEARDEKVPARADAQNVLVELIASHERSLAFAQVVRPELCKPELLHQWAQLFARACRNPRNGLLICFLCVQRRDPADARFEWLAGELATLARANRWWLADPLPPVEPVDLEEWIDAYNQEPALPELPRIDPRIAPQVFGDRESLRYREAIGRLLELLAPLLNCQQRFAA